MASVKPFRLLAVWLVMIHWAALSATAADIASAESPDPESRILGHWQGTGMAFLIEPVFKSDHTYYLSDEPAEKGTWSYRDGKYAMKGSEASFEASFDAEGRLILKSTVDPGSPEVALRRKGEIRPASSPATAQGSPTGQWRFAYINKSSIAAGPPFDAITFLDGKARLEFTPAAERFEVECQFDGQAFMFPTHTPKMLATLMGYMPLGVPYPRVARLGYRWENGGKTLILSNLQASRPFNCEWAFLRPDDFLPNNLAGTWVGKGSHTGRTMVLSPDGTMVHRELGGSRPGAPASRPKIPQAYYRLWKSPFGDAISFAHLDREMQLVNVQMARIEAKDREIILTPIECEFGETIKVARTGRSNWKLQAAGAPASAPAGAAASAPAAALTVSDLAGDWIGKADGVVAVGFSFRPDGSVVWRVDDPGFKREAPGGIKGKFQLTRGPQFHEIHLYEFESPLGGADFFGIIEWIDSRHMKMELSPEAKLTEFSVEAIEFERQ